MEQTPQEQTPRERAGGYAKYTIVSQQNGFYYSLTFKSKEGFIRFQQCFSLELVAEGITKGEAKKLCDEHNPEAMKRFFSRTA